MILDKFKLDGKKAVVTGGSRGIGSGMARALAQAGADLAIVSRKDNPEVRAELAALGRICLHHEADLSDRAQTKAVFPALADKLGGLDILINCAGITTRVANEEFPDADWDLTLETNLSQIMILSREAAKIMLPKGYGKIINVASVLSFQGGINVPAYVAAKHGVVGLTRSCCNAWAGRGINVNAIAPGYFATDLTQALKDDPERSAALIERVPAGRWGAPDELGGVAVFLASAASDFMHGSTLVVDGGWLAR